MSVLPERGSEWRPIGMWTVVSAFTNSTWWTWTVWCALVALVIVGYWRARVGTLSAIAEERWIMVGALGVGLVATMNILLWDSLAVRLVFVALFIIASVMMLIAMRMRRFGDATASRSGPEDAPHTS